MCSKTAELRSISLVCVIFVVSLQAAYAEDSVESKSDWDRATEFFQKMQEREDRVLYGIRWEWTTRKGSSQSLEQALQGEFDKTLPIDQYECKWLCYRGTFLHESIAQQPVRVLEVDKEQRATVTTNDSEITLWTANSRLLYFPNGNDVWRGMVQNKAHGLMENGPAPDIPVHSGQMGMKRSLAAAKSRRDSGYEVSFEAGITDSKVKCAKLILKKDGTFTQIYYFDPRSFLLLQSETREGETLRAKMVVKGSQEIETGTQKLILPTKYIYCSRYGDQKIWSLTEYVSKKIERERVPQIEMSVSIHKNSGFSLSPLGRIQKADFVETINVQNLDDVVERLYAKEEKK